MYHIYEREISERDSVAINYWLVAVLDDIKKELGR